MTQEEEIRSEPRRDFLKATGITCATLLAVNILPPFIGSARAKASSPTPAGAQAGNIKEVLRGYFGGRKISMTRVGLKVPIIAENGAVVPIRVVSDLPMEKDNFVRKIYIFVDENSSPYIASADFTPENGSSDIQLKIKMRKTSNVRAVAEMIDGSLYGDIKSVKVTIGGCGG